MACDPAEATILRGCLLPTEKPTEAILRLPAGTLDPSAERYHFHRHRIRVWEPLDLASFVPDFPSGQCYILPGAYQLRALTGYYQLRLRFGSASTDGANATN